MAWTVEDYKRLGMVPPAELIAQNTVKPVVKPLIQKPQSTAEAYRDALSKRLRESGVE